MDPSGLVELMATPKVSMGVDFDRSVARSEPFARGLTWMVMDDMKGRLAFLSRSLCESSTATSERESEREREREMCVAG